MTVRRFAAAVAAIMIAGAAHAQVTDSAPAIPHVLALNYARVRPFHRAYDIVLHSTDSATVIGRRDISFDVADPADTSAGWLLTESRTGTVNSLDSIFLAADLRPMRWSARLGPSTLSIAFSADSLSGDLRVGNLGSHIAAAIPPDLVLSASCLEVLAPLLPLSPEWSDSVSALTVTFGAVSVDSVELMVMAEDSVMAGSQPRSAWILSMRSDARETRMWVDRETGDVLRTQQLLPAHVGTTLEYRLLVPPATSP